MQIKEKDKGHGIKNFNWVHKIETNYLKVDLILTENFSHIVGNKI